MAYNGDDRRNGEPGRRLLDRSVCSVHTATLQEIGQMRSWFKWVMGLLVTGLIASAVFLGGTLKDFKCELTNIGKVQA